jgi:hypothetical protein
MKITNVADGPRGIFDKSGTMVTLNKGETRDVDLSDAEAKDLNKEWFKAGAAEKKAEEPEGDKPDRDALKARADELKLDYAANISTDKLKALVDEAEKSQA